MFQKWVMRCLLIGLAATGYAYNLGQYAEGGVIFFLTPDMGHGLVAAVTDQDGGSGMAWGNDLRFVSSCLDGMFQGEEYKTTSGSLNTDEIIAVYGSEAPAATACRSYSVDVGGITFDDWYLPSLTELRIMLKRKALINATALENGGTTFEVADYWSSLENLNSAETALSISFDPENPGTNTREKTAICRVRAIRSF